MFGECFSDEPGREVFTYEGTLVYCALYGICKPDES